jgi:hypothetical protein
LDELVIITKNPSHHLGVSDVINIIAAWWFQWKYEKHLPKFLKKKSKFQSFSKKNPPSVMHQLGISQQGHGDMLRIFGQEGVPHPLASRQVVQCFVA